MNWYVKLNFVCQEPNDYNSIGSWYFIGYVFGVILFFMPEKYGRKGTMNIVMPVYILSSYITLFGKSTEEKCIGFFL